jgi:hypothetical protein
MQVNTNVLGVEGFEIAVASLVKQDQQGHDFTGLHLHSTVAGVVCSGQRGLLGALLFEGLGEVIDEAEELE